MGLQELLDRVAALREAGTLTPAPVPEPADDEVGRQIALLLADPCLRPEHRARIYEDLLANRALLLERADPRLVDLVFWGEHVDSLYNNLKRGPLSTFHYARALEATCRRCGFDLLPVVGKMEELGRVWSKRQYVDALAMLSPDVVQVEAPRESPHQLGA